jgi:hypothetical protein
MAKASKEIPHQLKRITLHMADTIKTKLLPAITPTCHHQSIRHSRSLKEELSYVEMRARGDEAVSSAIETSRHNGKLAIVVDPSKGNKLDMTTAHSTAVTKIKDVLHAAVMTKGKAPAAMTRTRKIQLHAKQREAVAVAEIHRKTSRESGVTPHHPHQAAPMAAAVAVAVHPGHTAPEKIPRITSPMTRAPT